MSWTRKSIERANTILRELDAVYPSDGVHPAFQLMFSDDLISIVPQYTAEGQPVMEYRCWCGVDRVVHEPLCGGVTVAKVKMQKVPTFGLEGEFSSYPKSTWALCRWQPPPSKLDWVDMMGTDEDYPSNGRYLPVHKGQQCIVIPPAASANDYVDGARIMVKMMMEHRATWKAEIAASIEKSQELRIPIEDARGNVIREPPKGAPYWKMVDRLKNKMRLREEGSSVGYSKSIDKEPVNA